LLKLLNPLNHNPPLRFGTVKYGSTEEVIRKNYPDMYMYMKKYMENNISDGIRSVKEKYDRN
jgi:hypothetical protein